MTDLRYPLHWPVGRPRTPAADRDRARYGAKGAGWGLKPLTVKQASDRLWEEARAWRGRINLDGLVISTNVALRQDGWPRSNQKEPDDPGAVLYCTLDGEPKAFECDGWNRVADNIAAIAGWLHGQRSAERRRVGSSQQTFMGYAALPPVASDNTWYTVLGLAKMPSSVGELRAEFRKLAIANHPDVGGNSEYWATITAAYSQGIDALSGGDSREAL